jgi:hypothetical protein
MSHQRRTTTTTTTSSPAPLSLAESGAGPFAGVWAFKAQVPIIWSNIAVSPPVIAPIRFMGRIIRESVGASDYRDTMSLCGLELPPWRHQLLATSHVPEHRLVFPNALFDDNFFPSTDSFEVEHVVYGPSVGALQSRPVAIVAGVRLGDAVSTPWPTARDEVAMMGADDDEDGTPGISTIFDQQGDYTAASADMFGNLTIPKIGVGLRFRFSFCVRPLSMDTLEGTIDALPSEQIDSKGNIVATWPDARVLAAEVHDRKRGSIEPATSPQLNYINRFFSPIVDKSRPATISMWRITKQTSNRDIRQVVFA